MLIYLISTQDVWWSRWNSGDRSSKLEIHLASFSSIWVLRKHPCINSWWLDSPFFILCKLWLVFQIRLTYSLLISSAKHRFNIESWNSLPAISSYKSERRCFKVLECVKSSWRWSLSNFDGLLSWALFTSHSDILSHRRSWFYNICSWWFFRFKFYIDAGSFSFNGLSLLRLDQILCLDINEFSFFSFNRISMCVKNIFILSSVSSKFWI